MRRMKLPSARLAAAFLVFATCLSESARAQQGPWVYVGTYTGPRSKGIYVMRMDAATGALTEPQVAAEVPSPSFLAIDPNQKCLYAVSEIGGKTGGIFQFDTADGKPIDHGSLIFSTEAIAQYVEFFRSSLAGPKAVIKDPFAK